jgi:nucleotide-binding universal stress UspA family protein
LELHGPILCATDLSDAADAAIREGHAIATQIGAPFIVCHVLPEAFSVRVLFPQDAGTDASLQAELGHKVTVAVRQRLDAVVAGESQSIPIEIETGTAHAGVVTVAERVGAGLIILGHGATAQRVARSADVPVLIARPSPADGAILGATDFSDPSLPALQIAASEAKRRGARLRVVHCLDLGEAAYGAGARLSGGALAPWPLPQPVTNQLEGAARDKLSTAMATIDMASEAVVLRQPAAVGILEAAQAVATALIVVGTRGRTGLARLALGSVAEAVISQAACSVLVVPLNPS